MIGPAIPELKYVHKFRLIDGHGVVEKFCQVGRKLQKILLSATGASVIT